MPETLREPLTPNSPGVIWAAGFLEGEGYFILRGRRGICIGANQVNYDPLQRLAEIFESGRIYRRERPRGERQPWWGWQVGGKPEVLRITDLVTPWLSSERLERIPWVADVTLREGVGYAS